MLCNSRGPQSLLRLREAMGCAIGSVDDAANFGEIILAAIPLQVMILMPRKQPSSSLTRLAMTPWILALLPRDGGSRDAGQPIACLWIRQC